MQRWSMVIVTLVPLSLVGSCASHRARAVPPGTPTSSTSSGAAQAVRRFTAGTGFGLTFEYPSGWRAFRYTGSSSFQDPIVYLSNATLHDPCTRTVSPAGETATCGEPIRRLAAGQVLVFWSDVGFPHTGPEIPHPNARYGDQPADIEIVRPGNCRDISTDETITVDIARSTGNHYEMQACLRGPDVRDEEFLVDQMLESVRVTT